VCACKKKMSGWGVYVRVSILSGCRDGGAPGTGIFIANLTLQNGYIVLNVIGAWTLEPF